MSFVEIERDYIRSRVLPDFEWVSYSEPSPINPLRKPVTELRVALVTTAGVHTDGDAPFNLKSRTGDPSYREIPTDVSWDRLQLAHVGYNTRRVSQDINCVFPLKRLRELEAKGAVGSVNHRHFSFMGYVPVVGELLRKTGPEVAQKLSDDGVDLVVLSPA